MLEKQIQELSQSQSDTHKGEYAIMISKLEEMSRSINNNEQNIHSKYTELINLIDYAFNYKEDFVKQIFLR